MKKLKISILLFCFILIQSTFADTRLDLIELPDGFKIEIYAHGVENARQIVRGALLISDDAADVIYRVSYKK